MWKLTTQFNSSWIVVKTHHKAWQCHPCQQPAEACRCCCACSSSWMLSLALWEGTSGKSDTSHVSQQNGPGCMERDCWQIRRLMLVSKRLYGKEPLTNQTHLMLVSKMALAVWEGTSGKSDTSQVSQQNGPGCMERDCWQIRHVLC